MRLRPPRSPASPRSRLAAAVVRGRAGAPPRDFHSAAACRAVAPAPTVAATISPGRSKSVAPTRAWRLPPSRRRSSEPVASSMAPSSAAGTRWWPGPSKRGHHRRVICMDPPRPPRRQYRVRQGAARATPRSLEVRCPATHETPPGSNHPINRSRHGVYINRKAQDGHSASTKSGAGGGGSGRRAHTFPWR
jgi:hypothetical protein